MKKYTLVIALLFLFPSAVHAEDADVNIALGKFFSNKIHSLIFKEAPSVVIFQSGVDESGKTYVPNPLGKLRPIGPLKLINLPPRVLVNISTFVVDGE